MGIDFEEGAKIWMDSYMPEGISKHLQFMIDNGLGPEDLL
jgi:hypothetical protein